MVVLKKWSKKLCIGEVCVRAKLSGCLDFFLENRVLRITLSVFVFINANFTTNKGFVLEQF